MDKIKALLKDKEKMRELISYLIFGVLTTVVSWGVYYVWRQAFKMTSYPTDSAAYTLIATSGQVVSFVLSVLFAFVTNKKYVFKSEKTAGSGLWREFALFVSARIMAWVLFDLALFNLLLLIAKNMIADADLWLKLLMNVLVVIFNYVASKWVIFKK
ncbi:MAG: GtrA family protein [Clostridia bacterium]|nr:GtrA family protein [Clostridia bacterium]